MLPKAAIFAWQDELVSTTNCHTRRAELVPTRHKVKENSNRSLSAPSLLPHNTKQSFDYLTLQRVAANRPALPERSSKTPGTFEGMPLNTKKLLNY